MGVVLANGLGMPDGSICKSHRSSLLKVEFRARCSVNGSQASRNNPISKASHKWTNLWTKLVQMPVAFGGCWQNEKRRLSVYFQ